MRSTRKKQSGLKTLGKSKAGYTGLEIFHCVDDLSQVVLTSDEVTALCPVTGQPDWYTVTVTYSPRGKCIESKTFKLLLHSLRNTGMFCEALASHILGIVVEAVSPATASCQVVQKPRGGVSIVATASRGGVVC